MRFWRRSIISSKSTASSSLSAPLLVAAAGLPLLYFLNSTSTRSICAIPTLKSISTFLDLRKDPNTGANAINVMTNSEADAKKIEAKLEKVPEVLRVISLDSFVPEDQPAKLKLIAQGAKVLNPALNPESIDAAAVRRRKISMR